MVKSLLIWWTQQMLDLMAPLLRPRGSASGAALIVEMQPNTPEAAPIIRISRRHGNQIHALGAFPLDEADEGRVRGLLQQVSPRGWRGKPRSVVLRLSPEALLERQVVLPIAAERDPARVLHYEMDRNTPFQSDELYWSCRIERRDPAAGKLHLRLSLVLKAELHAIVDALAKAGAPVTWLEAPRADGSPRVIGLHSALSNTNRRTRPAIVMLAAVCGILATAAASLPFVLQAARADETERLIDELRPRVAEAEALRRVIAVKTADADVFATDHDGNRNPLQVLATITDILPDDTYLTELTLHAGKLSLEGRSGDAARLIAGLSADPTIKNPAFAAPVTRTSSDRTDQFSIRAEVAN